MLSSKIKDIKVRSLFFRKEKIKIFNKFLFINLMSNKSILGPKFNINILRRYFFFKISKVNIKNRCIITGRNQGLLSNLSISRIAMRELIQFGILPGYKKAVW